MKRPFHVLDILTGSSFNIRDADQQPDGATVCTRRDIAAALDQLPDNAHVVAAVSLDGGRLLVIAREMEPRKGRLPEGWTNPNRPGPRP